MPNKSNKIYQAPGKMSHFLCYFWIRDKDIELGFFHVRLVFLVSVSISPGHPHDVSGLVI